MRIASGCDDTGFPLKEQVAATLEASGHDLLDLGTFSTNPVDHPDYARAVGQAVLRNFVDAGVLICGNGAKENTASLLGAWKESKKLPEWPADAEENGLVLMANSAKKPAGVSPGLQAFLGQAVAGDYIASRRTWRPRRTRGADCRSSGRSCATASSSRPRWHSARATCTRRGSCTKAAAPTASSFRSRARTRKK